MKRSIALGLAGLAAGCTTISDQPQAVAAGSPPAVPASADAPPGYQYLYGSGEGGAEALTALHALIAYASEKAAHRPADSVVVAAGSPLVHATFVPCGARPLAVVFDMDETLVYNLGFEARAAAGETYDKARWARWESDPHAPVAAAPGAVHAVTDLRKLNVAVIVNTNRRDAAGAHAALAAAGLGSFVPGETLFLQDDATGTAKDSRRAAISVRYCVIAMAGDQLGDFSDIFNQTPFADRRALAVHSSAAGLWGKGWFVMPNPVYGSALKGGVGDIFPAATNWSDAHAGAKP